MNVHFLPWLTLETLLGALLGFQFGKGDLQAPLIVGAVGALLGLVGFSAVAVVHRAWKIDACVTDHLAIVGALLGAICGGVIGALSGLGGPLISIFNPDLPERDVGTFFDASGGIVLGAFFGACLVSAIAPFLRRRRLRHGDTVGQNNRKANST